MAHDPAVMNAVQAIQAEARRAAVYTLATAMGEANDVIVFAKAQKNSMAYCKTVELRAKLSGLLVDRREVAAVDIRGALTRRRRGCDEL